MCLWHNRKNESRILAGKFWSLMDLYGQNDKAVKPSLKSINDQPKRSLIRLRVKTMEDLARLLRKCTGYMILSLIYPAINTTKLAAFVDRAELGEKGRVTRSRIGHAFTIFCPLLWLQSFSEPDKFLGCSISGTM